MLNDARGRMIAGVLFVVVLLGVILGSQYLRKRAAAEDSAVITACIAWVNENPIPGSLAVASFDNVPVAKTDQGYTVEFPAQVAGGDGVLVNRTYTCSVARDAQGQLTVVALEPRP